MSRCHCGRPLASLPIDGTYAAETDDGVPVLALQHTCPCRGYTLSRIAPHPVVAAVLAVLFAGVDVRRIDSALAGLGIARRAA